MTDRKRLGRIKRLVWLKERRRDAAQAHLAQAQAEAQAAAQRADDAEQRFEEQAAADSDAPPSSAPLSDWIVQRQHVTDLGLQAEGAHAERRQAESTAAERQGDVHHAERELRQMEKWSEVEKARAELEGQRREQGATDELAAQITERKR